MFDVTSFVILIAIGIGGGIFGSLIGVGGGIIFAPALTLMGLNPSQISSTSLVAVTSTSISSVFSYARQRRIKYVDTRGNSWCLPFDCDFNRIFPIVLFYNIDPGSILHII